jgi:hypothetical protein
LPRFRSGLPKTLFETAGYNYLSLSTVGKPLANCHAAQLSRQIKRLVAANSGLVNPRRRQLISAALTNSLNFKRLRNTTGTDSVCSGFVFLILVPEPVGVADADAQTT